MPVETDYAWAAGFLDGEGHFGSSFRMTTRGYGTTAVYVHAFQVKRAPLDRLAEILGGSVVETVPTKAGSRAWRWQVMSAKQLRLILPLLLPYLVLKKAEAEVLLETCLATPPQGGRGRRDTPEEQAAKKALVDKLKETRRTASAC